MMNAEIPAFILQKAQTTLREPSVIFYKRKPKSKSPWVNNKFNKNE